VETHSRTAQRATARELKFLVLSCTWTRGPQGDNFIQQLDEANMRDDNPSIFFLLSMLLLAFSFGLEVGVSLEKHRHCKALTQSSTPTQAAACPDRE